MEAVYFRSAAEFRAWLEKHHTSTNELLLGFYKKSSGKAGLTYPEAVDELLCFGWIDGVKRRVDDERYTHRVTPRRPRSIWSRVNVGHVARLEKAGRMTPAGRRAFAARTADRTGIYRFEQRHVAARPDQLPRPLAAAMRRHPTAGKFWARQPPGYRRTAVYWVTSAKQAATRERRLSELIRLCAARRRLGGK